MKKWFMVILIVIACIIFIINIAGFAFKRKNNLEIQRLLSLDSEDEMNLITETDIENLPDIIKEWLRNSNVVGKKPIKIARFNQIGKMRLDESSDWLDFQSSQVFTVTNPGFVWDVDVKMNPALAVLGRDSLIDGKGSMIIKLIGLIPVVDESGEEVDQGSMVRYLAEMIWFPTAAVSDSISWEPIDETSAKGVFKISENKVEAMFKFDESGQIVDIYADRMMKKDDTYSMEKWHIVIDEYETFGGFVIPSKARVMWELEDGTFEWLKMEINEAEFE